MISEQKESQTANRSSDDLVTTATYLSEMVDRTIRMEEERCASLRMMSGTLLTGSSIVSVALLTVAQPLFTVFQGQQGQQSVLLASYFIVMLALLASIVLSVVSQLRFGYQALPSPVELKEKIDDGLPFTEIDAARGKVKPMEAVWQGLSKRNNIMRGLLTASAICVFVAVGVTVLASALLLLLAFGMLW